MTASGEVLDQWVNRRRVPHRAFAQTPEQRLLVVPRGEIERGVERPSKSDEGILRAIDRLGRAGFETGLQIRGFRYGRRPRAPGGERLQGEPPQAAGRPMHENRLCRRGLARKPRRLRSEPHRHEAVRQGGELLEVRSRGAFRAVAAFTTTCELWDPFRDTGFTP